MSETTGTPAVGTVGTVAPYGLSMSDGRGNPAELRATYVGRAPSAWRNASTGEPLAYVYVLELESGERFLIESAAQLARIFRADEAPAAGVLELDAYLEAHPEHCANFLEAAPAPAAERPSVRAPRMAELMASPFPLGRL